MNTQTSSFGVRGRVIDLENELPNLSVRREPRSATTRRGGIRRVLWWIAALLCIFALWQFSSAGWIHAKAFVAQQLIERSWQQAMASGAAVRPWPWADTRPIARLTVAGRDVRLYVLDGASGRSLAFGPGHVSGTTVPGGAGNSVIVAHRDTHFAFLRDIAPNEEIAIETEKGKVVRYRVRESVVVDQDDTRVLEAADSPQLTLITCYPFDAVQPGTTQRYVVIADRIG